MKSAENMETELKKINFAAESISVYRSITADRIISKLRSLTDSLLQHDSKLEAAVGAYSDLCFEIFHSGRFLSLKNYIIEKIIFDENIFSLNSEKYSYKDINKSIKGAAATDLLLLQLLAGISPEAVKEYMLNKYTLTEFEKQIVHKLPSFNTDNAENPAPGDTVSGSAHVASIVNRLFFSASWSECIEELAQFHNAYGSGIFSKYKAFVWEHRNGSGFFRGIEHPDPVTLKDLVGYDLERSEVIDNTKQFLKGFRSNNVLLYGDRGTGKSSTVKAILNEYHTQGLRLVEIPKKHLFDFPDIIRTLSGSNLKFIIFIDDLAFEDSEDIYTELKAVLEGGIESKPENVVIYATSNRRHLIKEKFSDRAGLQYGNQEDEVRASDTMQEKLSLSDRFGITVVFSTPDKFKFLEIVDGIALARGLKVDKEYLHKEALKWELWYNGRSPRTARQFVDWLEGKSAQDMD